jgi:signal transduction histidine kinase
MGEQLDHYLKRARVAAQRDSVVYRTPVTPLLERLVRVIEKLGRMKVSLTPPTNEIVFAGEREDLEEIVGNLLDNAMKWAKSRIAVSVLELPAAAGEAQRRFSIVIEDDGPGIPEDKAREALKRGRRLDETKPGSGLGLAIVAELVNEYGGRLSLERSGLGGLKAVVELRSVSG